MPLRAPTLPVPAVTVRPDVVRQMAATIESERETVLKEALRRQGPKRADVVDVLFALGVSSPDDAVTFRLGVNADLEFLEWSLCADASGSVTVDVLVGATLAGLASICGTGKPALSGAQAIADQAVVGWTPNVKDKQWMRAAISGTPSGVQVVTLSLRARKVV